MYQQDINVDHVMREYSISATAARALFHINRYIYASRRSGKRDARGVAYCYASRNALAEAIGKSRRTADRAIAELKAAGLITLQRTRHNGHIYLTAYSVDSASAVNGASGSATNGTSNINPKNFSIKADISILQHKTPAEAPEASKMAAKAADDAKIAEASARIATPAAEKMQEEGNRDSKKGQTPKKGRPTAKRRQRITKAAKEAAKAEYTRLLERKLDMANLYWLIPEADIQDEYRRRYSLIDLIAEAMSVKGRQIRVNGAGLSVEQYWNVVQNISGKAIEGLFDRLYTAETITGITNKRAYTLAAVYNAVQWDMMTEGADIPTEALYRHMAQ